jgi:hypothetical protein
MGAIATPRSGHFIQNYSKVEYAYGLVATSPIHRRESLATRLWFVGYSNRSLDALPLFWFEMKQSQCQETAILCNISVSSITSKQTVFLLVLASNTLQFMLSLSLESRHLGSTPAGFQYFTLNSCQ